MEKDPNTHKRLIIEKKNLCCTYVTYMQKKNGGVDICINKIKKYNQIFGNFGAVTNGLLRSIKRFPSAL